MTSNAMKRWIPTRTHRRVGPRGTRTNNIATSVTTKVEMGWDGNA